MADLLDGVLEALRSRRIALDVERARLDSAIAVFEALPSPTGLADRSPTAKPAKGKAAGAARARRTASRARRKTPPSATRDRLVLKTVLGAGPDGVSAQAIGKAHPSLSSHAVAAATRRLTATGQIQKRGATRAMRYYG